MAYPNQKNGFSKKCLEFSFESVMLKDVPLDVRRKEAAKPLFLKRI
jgi:hypothetical protein